MRLVKTLVVGIMASIFLVACSNDNGAEKVEKPAKVQKEFTTMEEMKKIDWENPDKAEWDKVYISEKTFKDLLKEFTTPDEEGVITYKDAQLKDDKTIELKVNNSDGESLENVMQAAILDTFVREFYKHSELYDDKKEPTIRTIDLSGTLIAENKKAIDYEEGADSSENTAKNLGTFKVGEKVNVEGHIITLTNARYTDERNEFEETQPNNVLIFDVEYQNGTQEEQLIDGGDFEVYDSKGEKMETYPIDYITESVQPGKHVKGQAAFGVTGNAPYEIYYKDFMTESKATWIMEVK
ncbi:DUF4352 domain-containing protein [Bacillus cihuensis]|uniref:DUF4352 domain-containing protein n=1 Tax=Bacillus cihuensis TaxID=1208599 RepID=UPI00040193C7|nr:DUF4352 domain-containing protein [Bacillus cihuensis]